MLLIDKYDMRLPKVSMENINLYIKEVAKLACIDEPVKISYKRGNQLIEETRPKYALFHPIPPVDKIALSV